MSVAGITMPIEMKRLEASNKNVALMMPLNL